MEWIKITDCRPDFGDEVLLCVDGEINSLVVGKLINKVETKDGIYYRFETLRGDTIPYLPTHWLPILSPFITRVHRYGDTFVVYDGEISVNMPILSKISGMCYVIEIEDNIARIRRDDNSIGLAHISSLRPLKKM